METGHGEIPASASTVARRGGGWPELPYEEGVMAAERSHPPREDRPATFWVTGPRLAGWPDPVGSCPGFLGHGCAPPARPGVRQCCSPWQSDRGYGDDVRRRVCAVTGFRHGPPA